MPYKSKKQQRFMNAVHPGIAAKWNQYPMPSYQNAYKTIPEASYYQSFLEGAPKYTAMSSGERGVVTPNELALPIRNARENVKSIQGELRGQYGGDAWTQEQLGGLSDPLGRQVYNDSNQFLNAWNTYAGRDSVIAGNEEGLDTIVSDQRIGPRHQSQPLSTDFKQVTMAKGGFLPSYQASTATIGSPYDSGYQWDDPTYSASPDQERIDPIEAGHAALDAAGMVPGLGIIPDLINAGWYGTEGDYTGMGLSAAAALPIAGLLATPAKYAKKVISKAPAKTAKKLTKAEIAKLPVLSKKEIIEKGKIIPAKIAPPAKQVEKIGDLTLDINKRLKEVSNIKKGEYKNWRLKVETAPNNSKRLITMGKPPGSETWERLGFMDFDKIKPSLFSDAPRSVSTKFTMDNPGFSRGMDYPTKWGAKEGFGIGAEFSNAINKSLKAKKNVLLSSSKHTKAGLERYLKSLVAGRTRIPPVSNSYDYVKRKLANLDFVPTSYAGISDELKAALEHTTFRYLEDGGYLFPMAPGGNISTTGYKKDSPDRFNSYNIIPSNNITMKGVNKPIKGTPIDKTGKPIGESKVMTPEHNYQFPVGSLVHEEPLPMYFGGGDIDWGGVASGAASGAGAGTMINPGWGTAIGALVGGGAALYSQSQQHKAQEQEEAEAEEAKKLQEDQQEEYLAMSQFIAPPSNEPTQPQYGKSWGAQDQPWGQAGGYKPIDYSSAFYKKGGKLPKYQTSDQGIPGTFYNANKAFNTTYGNYEKEQRRIDEVIAESVRLAEQHAKTGKDYTRGMTGSGRDTSFLNTVAKDADIKADLEAGKEVAGYIQNPDGTYSCYGDTCITAATSLKREAGATDISGKKARRVTGNQSFESRAPGMGYEKVKYANRKPGDIVQVLAGGRGRRPYHALTLGKDDKVYYDPGSYREDKPFRSAPLAQYVDTDARRWGPGTNRTLSGDDQANFWRYIGDTKRLDAEATKARELLQSLDRPSSMPITKPWEQPIPSQELKLPESVALPEPTASRNRRRLFNFESGGYLPSYQASNMPIPTSPQETSADSLNQWAEEKDTDIKNWFKQNINTSTTTKLLEDMGISKNIAKKTAKGLKFLKNVYLPEYQASNQYLPYQQQNPYTQPIGPGYGDWGIAPIPQRDPFAQPDINAMMQQGSNQMLGQFDIQQANREKFGLGTGVAPPGVESIPARNFAPPQTPINPSPEEVRPNYRKPAYNSIFTDPDGGMQGTAVPENYTSVGANTSAFETPQNPNLVAPTGGGGGGNAVTTEGTGGGGGAGWAQAAPAIMGIGASIYGASQLTKNKDPKPPATNPYMDLWQAQQSQAMNRPQRGGGMDIPTARSLGFTQSYAKKGGCLPMYQAANNKIGEFTGEFTMKDLRGTEMLSGLDEPGQYQIDFVNYINTGIGGDKLGQGLKKAEAMRQHHLKKKIEYHNKRDHGILDTDPNNPQNKIAKYNQMDHGFLEPGWTPPKYQGTGSFIREGTWNPRTRTMEQDPNRAAGGKEAYGMNTSALDFGDLPLTDLPVPNQNTNPNPYATPNAYNPMLMAQKGGYVNPNASFEAERGEIIEEPAGKPAIALEHGGTVRNSNNYQRVTGNKHSAPEGGPQMTGAEGGFVYSDFLKMPKDLVQQLKYLT